jgi:F0F1-type ATP synthase assembly protein I
MRKGPHEIPYLKESYERAWKRYLKEMKREEAEKARKRKEAERQRKGTKREEGQNRTKVAALVYAVVVPMMGAAIGLLAFVTEVLATKPVPG